MFSAGLFVLLLACALVLSALQGWALDGESRVVRHLVAWLAGTLLVSAVLVACWGVAATWRPIAGGGLPRPIALLGLTASVALGVAAALGGGAVHARRAAGERWIGRAMVQGVTLCVVGTLGTVALVFLAVSQGR